MMSKLMIKRNIKRKSLLIRKNTAYFFLGEQKINEVRELPETNTFKFAQKILPKNSFFFYENEQTKLAIVIFTLGRRLYIRPSFFQSAIKKDLLKIGLHERKFDNPFAKGAVPYNLEWIQDYIDEYSKAEKQYNFFCEMMFGG